ncbi:MAG: hypothetical protein IPP34_08110 [Bacteroidetes bacterium]|nr:hypothetical protein [Bacteroidota bacterium]
MNTDITTGGMVSSPSGSLNCNNAILDLNSHTAIIHNINPAGITASTGFILSEDADNSSKVWWEFVGQGLHTIPFGNSSGSHVPFSFLPLPSMSGGCFQRYGCIDLCYQCCKYSLSGFTGNCYTYERVGRY